MVKKIIKNGENKKYNLNIYWLNIIKWKKK